MVHVYVLHLTREDSPLPLAAREAMKCSPVIPRLPWVLGARFAPGGVRRLLGSWLCGCGSVHWRKLGSFLNGNVVPVRARGILRSVFWDEWRERSLLKGCDMLPLEQWVSNAAPEIDAVTDPVDVASYLE